MVDMRVFIIDIDTQKRQVTFWHEDMQRTAPYNRPVEKHLKEALEKRMHIVIHFNWTDRISKIHQIGDRVFDNHGR